MMKRLYILFFSLLILGNKGWAQCSALGQNPSTAFPVCGVKTFDQNTVPICDNGTIFVPGCSGGKTAYTGKNPYWYKFTCYQTGTLGFLITPKDLSDDYDWQLYDVTGRDPNDIFRDKSLVVTANWAGTPGASGARAGGINFIQCASGRKDNKPSFTEMPTLIVGHDYLLLISHFTDSQSGYNLSFGGGTANITDPKLPVFTGAEAACTGQQVTIRLNKKMKCSSLAANGTDFSINTGAATITGAASKQCSTGFDMDELTLTLSAPLVPGNYVITAKKSPADGNTLLDNCDNEIPVGASIPFTIIPLAPTPMDSINKVKCAPTTLELVFKKGIQCSSIASNGSDFIVSGPVPVTVISAAGINCVDGISKKILVQLSGPLQVGSPAYNIRLKVGTDGNTILDECAQQTPAGSNLNFAVADTVNADFTFTINYSCAQDIVQYNYVQKNNVNTWLWTFDNSLTSSLQNPVIPYTDFHDKQTRLIVSNGVCTDTSSQRIVFDNFIEADFEITNVVCPNEPAKIINHTIGRIVEWRWAFGNGGTSNIKDPAPQTFPPRVSSDYIAFPQLIAKNDYGCYDTVRKPVKIVFSCYIAVPTAFTPNGDGVNDYLYPLSAYKAKELSFSVYNRFGQKLFYTSDWTRKWDGRFKGQDADPATYVWVLSYINSDTGKRIEQKGTSILIR